MSLVGRTPSLVQGRGSCKSRDAQADCPAQPGRFFCRLVWVNTPLQPDLQCRKGSGPGPAGKEISRFRGRKADAAGDGSGKAQRGGMANVSHVVVLYRGF